MRSIIELIPARFLFWSPHDYSLSFELMYVLRHIVSAHMIWWKIASYSMTEVYNKKP